MAGKLTALILLLVAVGSASAYSYRGDKCDQEMDEQMPMRSCMRWARGPSYGYAFRSGEEEHLNECCQELRQLSSECRCRAVKEMMMDMPQGQLEMQRMMCSLPTKCGMSACSCPRYFS